MAIHVCIVDDHALMREGLRMMLEAQEDLRVVGEAANGQEAVEAVSVDCPDVVLMDVMMPVLNGIEATRQVRRVCPSTAVVMLSMYADQERIVRALQAGAIGYVLKDSSSAELIQAIRAARIGEHFFSQRIARIASEQEQHFAADPLQRLNERERHILQLIAEGQTSAEISKIFQLSPKTIETYRSRLMRKLDIDTIAGLVKFAIKHGVTSLDDIT